MLNDAGYWGYVLDVSWRVVFVTDELRLSHGDTGDSTCVPIGQHWYGVEMVEFRQTAASGSLEMDESRREHFRDLGRYVLAAAPGGRDGLRRVVAPELSAIVDELEPVPLPHVWSVRNVSFAFASTQVPGRTVYIRIDDNDGQLVGVAIVAKPAAGMSQLAAAAAMADLGHLERMRLVERPDRRPGAVLMADLEASTPLARRLATAQYFAFGRRLVRTTDQCIIDEGASSGSSLPKQPVRNPPPRARVSAPRGRCATVSVRSRYEARSPRATFPCASDCNGAPLFTSGGS